MTGSSGMKDFGLWSYLSLSTLATVSIHPPLGLGLIAHINPTVRLGVFIRQTHTSEWMQSEHWYETSLAHCHATRGDEAAKSRFEINW